MQDRLIPVPYSKNSTDQCVSDTFTLRNSFFVCKLECRIKPPLAPVDLGEIRRVWFAFKFLFVLTTVSALRRATIFNFCFLFWFVCTLFCLPFEFAWFECTPLCVECLRM